MLAIHSLGMSQYRFVTPHRAGKWYPDLLTAQRQAFAIGAGFLDPRSGMFYVYKGAHLEVSSPGQEDDPRGIAA